MKKREKRRFSLAARFGILFYAAALLLIVALSVTLFSYFHNNVENSLLASYSQTVSAKAQTINDLLTRLDLYMNLVTDGNGAFLDTLLEYDGNFLTAWHSYVHMKDMLKSNLDMTFGSIVPSYEAYLIVDESMPLSKIMSQYPLLLFQQNTLTPSIHITLPAPFENEDWYRHVQENPGQDYWFTLESKPNSLSVVRALRVDVAKSPDYRISHYNIGSIVVSFDADWFDSGVAEGRLGESTLLLLDSDGHILHSSDPAYADGDWNVLAAPSRTENRVAFDGEYCQFWKSDLQSGLTLVTLLPYEKIRALTMGSLRIVFAMAPALLTAGFILILLISRYATYPIRRLAQHMQRKSLTPIAPPTRGLSTEVDGLYSSFNSQIERINELLGEVRASEQSRKQAEIQLLQAQINPHFVCNTLGTVCCRSLMRGDDDLADILTDLADFMRYNLRNPSQHIPLSQELEVIDRFIRIQQSCGKDDVPITLDVSPECLNLAVPKLILQPIVENALSHTDDPRSVRLFIRRHRDRLIMRVENHSPGTYVNQINDHISGRITLTSKSTGLGIRNINQRLHLSYGEEYGLTFYALPDDFIAAELIMPAETAAEKSGESSAQ